MKEHVVHLSHPVMRMVSVAVLTVVVVVWLIDPAIDQLPLYAGLLALASLLAGVSWGRSIGTFAAAFSSLIAWFASDYRMDLVPFVVLAPLLAWLGAANRSLSDDNRRWGDMAAEHRSDLEAALEIAYRQIGYEETVIAAAQAFLGMAKDITVPDALRQLGEATAVDTVMLSRNVERGDGLYSMIEHWIASEAELPAPSFDTAMSWSRLPNVASRLSSGRPNVISSLAEVPYPDRRVYEASPTGLASYLEVPVVVDGHWGGTIGLGTYAANRSWTPAEVDLLEAVSGMAGAAWSRTRMFERLGDAISQRDRSLRLQAALAETSRTLLEGTSAQSLEEALEILVDAAGVDAAYFVEPTTSAADAAFNVWQAGDAASAKPALRISESQMSELWHGKNPLHDGRPQILDEAGSGEMRARLEFPVMEDGRMAAVVGIADRRAREWTPAEIRMMGSVARMFAAHRQSNRARRALEELVKAKDRFIASVSHELRTPMSVVLGLSSELNTRWDEFSEAEVAEFIDLISRQSREVSNIIEDLLVSARVQETAITVVPEPIRLDIEVTQAISDLPSEHTWRIVETSLPPLSAFADPLRVRQIVRNLIVNSHRYGGSQVWIRLQQTDDAVTLVVADSGPGIPESQREEIFEPYRSVAELTGRTAALGLGLTVSRQLARLMGGDVTYTHDELSAFHLSLPAAVASDQEISKGPASDQQPADRPSIDLEATDPPADARLAG